MVVKAVNNFSYHDLSYICVSLIQYLEFVGKLFCSILCTWEEWAIAMHGRYESYILLILFTHICYIHSMTFFVFSTIYFESKTLQNTISYQITLSNNSIRLEHILLTPTSSLYTSSTFYLTLSLSAHLFHTVFQ